MEKAVTVCGRKPPANNREPLKETPGNPLTPAITCGPRRARALRAAGGGSEVRSFPRKARDRPDRQVHRDVSWRIDHLVAPSRWNFKLSQVRRRDSTLYPRAPLVATSCIAS